MNHWIECECGEKDAVYAHTFVDKYDSTSHWKECSCGYSTPKLGHSLEQKNDDNQHWIECLDCDYVSEKSNHNLFDRVDDNNHWSVCDCGFSTTKVAHTLEDKYDNAQHWQECSDCVYETTRINHVLENQDDFYSHWIGCKDCEYDGEKTTHYYQVEHDDNQHWQGCSCGKKVEIDNHSFTMKHDADTHWQECACGYKKDITSHNFGELNIDTPATCIATAKGHRVCGDCGEVKYEDIPNADGETGEHQYDGGVVTTPASGNKCGVMTYTCGLCTHTKTEVIPHTYAHDYRKYVPVSDFGHARKCSYEGCDALEGNVYQHNFNKFVIDEEPDGDKPGHKHTECSTCGYHQASSEVDFNDTLVENIEFTVTIPTVGGSFYPNYATTTTGVVINTNYSTFYDDNSQKIENRDVTSDDIGRTFKCVIYARPRMHYYFRLNDQSVPVITATLNGISVTCPEKYNSGMWSGGEFYYIFSYLFTLE